MMILVQTLATDGMALCVGFAAVCRLSQLHIPKYKGVGHKPGWVITYLIMAIGAIVAFFESADGKAGWATLVLLTACAFWVWLSRISWRNGPPRYLERS